VLHVRTPVRPEQVHKHRCDSATRLVAISQRVRRNLISAGISPEKISLIDDSVDLELFRPNGAAGNVLRQDFPASRGVLIGLVGRIKPSKHQLEFLQAAAKLRQDSKTDVTFFLIGEVYSPDYFNKLVRFAAASGIERDVIFTGRREDMPEVLGSLDIVVSLSGGSVMFEAMACGKCVVSAGFSSRADSVHLQDGRTGVLVESKDPAELKRALLGLMEHPEVRHRIGREARKWVMENLCRDKMTVQTRQVYDELMNDRSQVMRPATRQAVGPSRPQ
jgi:glycosyltransferase involved in cell wall biosynthesis